MLVSYSVGSLPYESRLFAVRFHVIESLPGGLDGLLGKEMCQPGHPFFDHIYVHHARDIEFWSDTHQPPEEVGASRTASSRASAAVHSPADAEADVFLLQRGAALAARRMDTLRRLAREHEARVGPDVVAAEWQFAQAHLDGAFGEFTPVGRSLAELRPGIAGLPVGRFALETTVLGDLTDASVMAAAADGASTSDPLPSDDELRALLRPNPDWPEVGDELLPILLEHRAAFRKTPYPADELTLPAFPLTLDQPGVLPRQCNRGPAFKPHHVEEVWTIVRAWEAAGIISFVGPDAPAYGFMFVTATPGRLRHRWTRCWTRWRRRSTPSPP
jgi:hypothetical protein